MHLDLSILSETAKLSQPETRWGVLSFWNTPQLLPLMIGERRAREVLLIGRIYDAQQAYELGLFNLVVPPTTNSRTRSHGGPKSCACVARRRCGS